MVTFDISFGLRRWLLLLNRDYTQNPPTGVLSYDGWLLRKHAVTFRIVLSASFSLLLLSSAFGQEGMQTSAPSTKPFTLTQVWNSDATYTDQRHGVAFRYPSVWKPENQFGYIPPALTQSQDEPIAGFGYEEGGFPRERVIGPYSATNLEGFGVVYLAVATADAAECESKASSLSSTPEHRVVTLRGRSFSEHETGGAGMSQSISGKLYATYVRPTCYLFETAVAEASMGALEDISALTLAQRHSIDRHLFDIMKSVRIVRLEQSGD